MHGTDMLLIKEKIIKTDEVLKLLLEKNVDLEKFNIKYKVVLNKYLEKCKQYQKLKKECDIICLSNDKQQTKISVLEEELSSWKLQYKNLQATHTDYINTSHLQYQSINQELLESQDKIKEQQRNILVLETTINNGTKKCSNCNKRGKTSKVRRRKDSHSESDVEMKEESGTFMIEAKTEISLLQNKVKLFHLENANLRNDLQKMENECDMLKEKNVSLKQDMRIIDKKNGKLQEKLNALLLEMELLKCNHTEKLQTCDIGVQTDKKEGPAANIMTFCDELICIPRLISPFEDLECDESSSPYGLQCSSPSELRDIHSLADDNCGNMIQSQNLNSSFISTRSEKLLDTGQLSSKCCTEYTASVQDDDTGESCLLGFASAQEEGECNYNNTKKRKRVRKTFMKRCSDEIYNRVLKNVLKYINSSKKKVLLQNCRNNKFTRRKTIRKKRYVRLKTKNSIPDKIKSLKHDNLNEFANRDNYCYDAPPDSVDSGCFPHISTESECSEILSCKLSGSISELNDQSIRDCDRKKRKLELFGSDSESDTESSNFSDSNLTCDSSFTPSVQIHRNVLMSNNKKLQKCKKTENSKFNNAATTSICNNVYPHSNSVEADHNDQHLLHKPELLSSIQSANFVTEDGINVSESNFPTLSLSPVKTVSEADGERKVFKRPNCRKSFLETPRSPEPEQKHEIVTHKPVIIPLNKPKPLTPAITNKLFEKLLTYPDEPQILEEVSNKLSNQEPAWISRIIIEIVSSDYHSKVENKDNPFAPLLTQKQKVLLGLMVKLEKKNISNIISTFLVECEKCILQEKSIERLIPLTRLYLAVCKMRRDVYRMRKTCLDAVYFMGDLVIPFLYTVLSSWADVLHNQNQSMGSILSKVIVQVINLKTCNFPGYNLLNLRTIISRLHGYPSERWNSDEMFAEIVSVFRENPKKQETVVALVLFCKNHSAKWVAEKLENLTNNLISLGDSLLKEKTIDILGKIMKQFDISADGACIKRVEECQRKLCDS